MKQNEEQMKQVAGWKLTPTSKQPRTSNKSNGRWNVVLKSLWTPKSSC